MSSGVTHLISPKFDLCIFSEVEMMIGGLTENSESRALLTPSVKYYQDDLTFCVAKALLAPSWMNVFAIFDAITWLFVFLLLLVSSYLLWKNSIIDDQSQGNIFWGFLQGLALTLCNCATYAPRMLGIRFFYMCFAIYGMHFNTAYQSFLITVLTRPRFQTQISTVDMAIAQGLHFKGSENTFNYFVSNLDSKEGKAAQYIVKNFEICTDIDECLYELSTDLKLAVAVSREHSENSPLMSKMNMYCFTRSNNIYNYLISVLARRDHHLLSRINRNIRGVLEAGLLSKWQLDSQRESDLKNFKATGDEEDNATIVLKWQHVQGAFYVALIGLFVSLIVFLLEIIVFQLSNTRTFKKLKSLENVFCYNKAPRGR